MVTYCWGPGCNGATRAALTLARLGYRVREMIGGFEHWVARGCRSRRRRASGDPDVDLLTAPAGITCGC